MEFVLVVVGILLALQIENWNQDRQDRRLEKTLLKEMHANLQSDLQDVEYNIAYNQAFHRSTQHVMEYLESDLPYHDSLSFHFSRLTPGTIFVANTSAFESLESIGINLIRNDSLRQQITFLYSAVYSYTRKLEDIVINNTLFELNTKLVMRVKPDGPDRTVPLDPGGLKGDNEFFSTLATSDQLIGFQIDSYQRTRGRIMELITNIEKELNQ